MKSFNVLYVRRSDNFKVNFDNVLARSKERAAATMDKHLMRYLHINMEQLKEFDRFIYQIDDDVSEDMKEL